MSLMRKELNIAARVTVNIFMRFSGNVIHKFVTIRWIFVD